MRKKKDINEKTSDEKLDMMLEKQDMFNDTMAYLIKKDKEKEEKIQKIEESELEMKNEIDNLKRIVTEELTIKDHDLKDVKDSIAKKIRLFCTNHGILYQIWSRSLFPAAYTELKSVCDATALTRILRVKTDLAKRTADNLILEDLVKVKMILVEARINDGKKFKVSPEKANYLYETIRYHIVTLQDWQTVSAEQIFKEAAINEANNVKY